MQIIIPISNHPVLGIKRVVLLTDLNLGFHSEMIPAVGRIYFTDNDGNLITNISDIPFRGKTLVVDNLDKVDLSTGNVVDEAVYNADPTLYPNAIGQFDLYMNITVGDLKAQGHTITDATKISELIIGLAIKNIQDSDARGKYN